MNTETCEKILRFTFGEAGSEQDRLTLSYGVNDPYHLATPERVELDRIAGNGALIGVAEIKPQCWFEVMHACRMGQPAPSHCFLS